MKEREKERAAKPDQAAVEGRPGGNGDDGRLGIIRWWQIVGLCSGRFYVCKKQRQPFSFGFGLWRVKKNNEGFFRVGSYKFLSFI